MHAGPPPGLGTPGAGRDRCPQSPRGPGLTLHWQCPLVLLQSGSKPLPTAQWHGPHTGFPHQPLGHGRSILSGSRWGVHTVDSEPEEACGDPSLPLEGPQSPCPPPASVAPPLRISRPNPSLEGPKAGGFYLQNSFVSDVFTFPSTWRHWTPVPARCQHDVTRSTLCCAHSGCRLPGTATRTPLHGLPDPSPTQHGAGCPGTRGCAAPMVPTAQGQTPATAPGAQSGLSRPVCPRLRQLRAATCWTSELSPAQSRPGSQRVTLGCATSKVRRPPAS